MSVSSAPAGVDSICILSFLGGMVDYLGTRSGVIDYWCSRKPDGAFEGVEAVPEIKLGRNDQHAAKQQQQPPRIEDVDNPTQCVLGDLFLPTQPSIAKYEKKHEMSSVFE